MKDNDKNLPLEDRIKNSPIHQWAAQGMGVEGYLEKAFVPKDLWNAFHEAMILRGEYPMQMNPDQEQEMQRKYWDIISSYDIPQQLGQPLYIMGLELVRQWKDYKKGQS